ncbi:hypothetical protein V6N12_004702 [Hibiscus sabdariffa]|uniref:Uncharacterized protein n=1 Tax=Hibiscus sabdariffa TaxID=183260 RepID=A0ABR2CPJ0_9ROSI
MLSYEAQTTENSLVLVYDLDTLLCYGFMFGREMACKELRDLIESLSPRSFQLFFFFSPSMKHQIFDWYSSSRHDKDCSSDRHANPLASLPILCETICYLLV